MAVATPEVREADKPFWLVIILLGVVVGLLVYTLWNGTYESVKEPISTLIGVLASGFMLYFRGKTQ